MRIDARFFQLTYCTNIHPGEDWDTVEATLRDAGPALKKRVSPDAPFGLGLRLSARAAREALESGKIPAFRRFLDSEGLYVAIVNGYPFGSFHGSVVKDQVFAPDWSDEARLRYTLDLLEILRQLVPDGLDGGISTMPLSYKPWKKKRTADDWEAIVRNLVRMTEALARVRRDEKHHIHLDIEPEPDGLVENTEELTAFYERWLLPVGGPMLAASLDISAEEARATLIDHIQVCFDCCHFAVEFEDPVVALDRLRTAGIGIGRVQLSSALKAELPADARRLAPFADSTYLHQVIEERATDLRHFPDLPQALASSEVSSGADAARPCRIHFHVPLFTAEYDGLSSTQDYVRAVLRAAVRGRLTRHLEIETYTWEVLPPGLKLDILDSISREFEWVRAEMSLL